MSWFPGTHNAPNPACDIVMTVFRVSTMHSCQSTRSPRKMAPPSLRMCKRHSLVAQAAEPAKSSSSTPSSPMMSKRQPALLQYSKEAAELKDRGVNVLPRFRAREHAGTLPRRGHAARAVQLTFLVANDMQSQSLFQACWIHSLSNRARWGERWSGTAGSMMRGRAPPAACEVGGWSRR